MKLYHHSQVIKMYSPNLLTLIILFAAPYFIRAEEFEGFEIDGDLFEGTIEDDLRSKHPFEKKCPWGYFACEDGECIAPHWRCDGHPDCDDFSDELNCTSIDGPSSINMSQIIHPNVSAHSVFRVDFNTSVEPLMLFSTGQSIRGLWMASRVYFDIVSRKENRKEAQASITEAFSAFFGMLGIDQATTSTSPASGNTKPTNTIVGLDMNPENKEVFWVELGKDPGVYSAIIEDDQFEARHRRQMRGQKKIVQYGLLSPEDIALDTVGRNIYVTDAGLPAVVVCSYVHVHCKVLVRKKIHKPRAIIADSSSGWIIYTDWGDHPGIFLVGMDGKRRETLIETDVVWPNGLAQDYASNYLYWADSRLNKIERVDLKTRKRYTLMKEVSNNPFSVSLFENRVYWSDWSGNKIKTCDKITGNNTRDVLQADDIYGIHIYHPDIHKSQDQANPCWSKHCSHLCLLSPPDSSTFGLRRAGSIGATCACPDSMSLSVFDKGTCYEVHLSFLLINVKNYIAQVFPERIGLRVLEEIVYSKEHAIQDIATDWLHYRLFFFDASRKQIFSADFSGRQTAFQRVTTVGVSSIRGLIYDIPSENLFWLDPEAGTLTMNSVRGKKFQKVLRHNLEHASSMVLDSRNRVFYIALMGAKPRIIRTDILAQESSDVVLLEKGEIGIPVALYLDESEQRLYWADSKYDAIESIQLDIKSRAKGCRTETRVKLRSRLGGVLSFAVYYDQLMWITEESDYMYKARMDDNNSRPVPFKLPPSPTRDHSTSDYKRLITVNPMSETLSSPCAKRSCSHACVLQDREATCICPDGLKLNGTNCVEASSLDIVVPSASASASTSNSNSQRFDSLKQSPDSPTAIDDFMVSVKAHSKAAAAVETAATSSAAVVKTAPTADGSQASSISNSSGSGSSGAAGLWFVVFLAISIAGSVFAFLIIKKRRAEAAQSDNVMLLFDNDS